MWKGHLIFGEISQIYLIESKFVIGGNQFFMPDRHITYLLMC